MPKPWDETWGAGGGGLGVVGGESIAIFEPITEPNEPLSEGHRTGCILDTALRKAGVR